MEIAIDRGQAQFHYYVVLYCPLLVFRETHGYLLYPRYRYRYRPEPSICIRDTYTSKYLYPKYLHIKYPQCI